jgi:type II secretory pathway predicted ATPase ExeA
MLSNALADSLAGEGVRAGKVSYSSVELLDFHAVVAAAFDLPSELATREAFIEQFTRFIEGARGRTERVLLVVDEAQDLHPEVLAEIERLLDVNGQAGSGQGSVLSILLVGENRLGTVLREDENRGLAGRIEVRCNLGPLDPDEVAAYIRHHLTMASIDPDRFTTDASREVAAVCDGIPRLIDMVCDQALMAADLRGLPTVSAPLIRECAAAVDGPDEKSSRVPALAWVDEVVRRLVDVGARQGRSVALASVVGLVGIGIGLAAGFVYRWRDDSGRRPVPVQVMVPAIEEGVAKPLAISPAAEPPSVERPAALRPGNGGTGSMPPSSRVGHRRFPRSDGASVAPGVDQRESPGTPGVNRGPTGGEPTVAQPASPPVVDAPALVAPRGEPARSAVARGRKSRIPAQSLTG